MQNYVNCSKVYVDVCEFGYGVFANQNIKEGEIIEIGLMYIINGVDGNNNSHLFTWSDDRSVWAGASGCIPFYNHSNIPNIKKIGDLVNNTMSIIALRDIMKGEELKNTYMSSKWRKCFNNLIN
jgi:SET domain-containing protein